jgi:hypothetical protein
MCKVTHEPPKDLVQNAYESSHEARDLAAVPNKKSTCRRRSWFKARSERVGCSLAALKFGKDKKEVCGEQRRVLKSVLCKITHLGVRPKQRRGG